MANHFDLQNQDVIQEYIQMVYHIAARFSGEYTETEDLISEGMYGFVKAMESFDPARGVKLSTYLYKCITNEINMYLRRENNIRSHMISGYEEPLESIAVRDCDKETDSDSEMLELLKEALGTLECKERNLLEIRYGLNGSIMKTQAETAAILGLSQPYVSKYEKKILQKLRLYIGNALNQKE